MFPHAGRLVDWLGGLYCTDLAPQFPSQKIWQIAANMQCKGPNMAIGGVPIWETGWHQELIPQSLLTRIFVKIQVPVWMERRTLNPQRKRLTKCLLHPPQYSPMGGAPMEKGGETLVVLGSSGNPETRASVPISSGDSSKTDMFLKYPNSCSIE